jgi:hypothetical protein
MENADPRNRNWTLDELLERVKPAVVNRKPRAETGREFGRGSKYAPLARFLAGHREDACTLSFADIEKITGYDLPPSARRYQAWWSKAKPRDTHIWAQMWQQAGWTIESVDLKVFSAKFRRTSPVPDTFAVDDLRALEGYRAERLVMCAERNRGLVDERKRVDENRCVVCGFRLVVNGSYVICVHHLNQLADAPGGVLTSIKDLVCLCPTCHQIAHMRRPPFTLEEIQQLRLLIG